MKCVRCRKEITTAECPQCGFQHNKESVYFFEEPNAKDIRIEFPDFEIENETLRKYKGTDMEVIVPDHVRKIGKRAFQGKRRIVGIKLPKGITEIQDYAFKDCTALREINLPDSVNYYGSGLFSGCTSLKGVKVGGNKSTNFQMTFSGSNLERIDFRRGIREVNMDDLNMCGSLRILKIPGSVQSLKRLLRNDRFGPVQVYAPESWKRKHSDFNRNHSFYHFADEPGTWRYIYRNDPAFKVFMKLIGLAAVLVVIISITKHINTNYIKSPIDGLLVAIDNIEPHPSGIPVVKIYENYYCREEIDGKYTYVKDAWREFDGKYYYFDEEGKMRTGDIWTEWNPGRKDIEEFGFHKMTGEMLTGEVSRDLLTDKPFDAPYEINGESTFCFDENGVFQWEKIECNPMDSKPITFTWEDSYQRAEELYSCPYYPLFVSAGGGFYGESECEYISCEANNITLSKGKLSGKWYLYIWGSTPDTDAHWIRYAEAMYDPETGKVTAEAELDESISFISACMLVYDEIQWGAECSFDMTVTKLLLRTTDAWDCSVERHSMSE